ncbi:hypothetical protein HPB47_025817 [Ixodes persulcatus]|uniref:Uncharacterized protein n=1 Tax=Ixodes persulcatus TaxID=34615 RepID=A0AC60Q2E6_IXOPE|nr:hypothetical protein HPB47_025817 [Ixodes persulcatus]
MRLGLLAFLHSATAFFESEKTRSSRAVAEELRAGKEIAAVFRGTGESCAAVSVYAAMMRELIGNVGKALLGVPEMFAMCDRAGNNGIMNDDENASPQGASFSHEVFVVSPTIRGAAFCSLFRCVPSGVALAFARA